jgi:hypothetical protein
LQLEQKTGRSSDFKDSGDVTALFAGLGSVRFQGLVSDDNGQGLILAVPHLYRPSEFNF